MFQHNGAYGYLDVHVNYSVITRLYYIYNWGTQNMATAHLFSGMHP